MVNIYHACFGDSTGYFSLAKISDIKNNLAVCLIFHGAGYGNRDYQVIVLRQCMIEHFRDMFCNLHFNMEFVLSYKRNPEAHNANFAVNFG